jgi:3-oxoacyl-(acyl-carrier-protein) synthase
MTILRISLLLNAYLSRVGIVLAEGAVSALLMRGEVALAVRWIWGRLVTHALQKKQRGKSSTISKTRR